MLPESSSSWHSAYNSPLGAKRCNSHSLWSLSYHFLHPESDVVIWQFDYNNTLCDSGGLVCLSDRLLANAFYSNMYTTHSSQSKFVRNYPPCSKHCIYECKDMEACLAARSCVYIYGSVPLFLLFSQNTSK